MISGRVQERGGIAQSVLTFCMLRIDDINKSCLDEFRAHWQCLDNNNQQLWQCRRREWKLNACVFDKLVCLCLSHAGVSPTNRDQKMEKTIPGSPEGETPVHLRKRQIFAHYPTT